MEGINLVYCKIKDKIEIQLKFFKNNWDNGDNKHAFTELVFCIFTPQSSAKACWDAVLKLQKEDLLFKGNAEEIKELINSVRFRDKKSKFLVEAREKFYDSFNLKDKIESFTNSYDRREWLVNNIKGYGYKEASHYLRNIGFAEDLAILDRHILKNLLKYNVIEQIPKSISKTTYIDIEKKMQHFAKKIDIDMQHLDFVFWYMEAGDVFK